MFKTNQKKIIGISILLLTMLLSSCDGGGKKTEIKAPEEQFIDERHALLDQITEENPERIIDGQIVFTTFIDNIKLLNLVKEYDIKIIELNHGSDFHNGGYAPENKTLSSEQIITNLLEVQKRSVNDLIKSAPVKDLSNPSYFGLQKRKTDLEAGIIYFYGLEGEAKTQELKKLKDSNKFYIKMVNPAIRSDLRVIILSPQ